MNTDLVTAPAPIKEKLRELSRTILFEKQSQKGANGWLFFGTNHIHKQRVAIKFYDWGGDTAYHAEPRNLAMINSDNVVKILDAALVNGRYAYFLTPYFSRGDLDEDIARASYANVRAVNLTRDILSGLSCLHAERLLHRDLKPQNILLSDNNHAVIGDFGSVKKIPEGHQTVPGSGHSLIYRPPESVLSDVYGAAGDIYQVGIVLYQLLGGSLPYEETSWLNSRELSQYQVLVDPIDKQVFAQDMIKRRIMRGRVLDQASLPLWVNSPLRRIISKACNIDPNKRYQSCSEFLAKIGKIRKHIYDWRLEDGYPVLYNGTVYRILQSAKSNTFLVQKRRGATWRYDPRSGK